MMRKYALFTIWLLVLAACGQDSSTGEAASPQASFDDTYAAAEAALAEAEAHRNVWIRTEDVLRQARVAYDEGRTDEAIRLATEAKLQAELALTQAISEREAWKTRVLTE